MITYAIELRLFYARCAIVYAPWARGAKGRLLVTDEKNGEKFGGVGNNTYLCSVIIKKLI